MFADAHCDAASRLLKFPSSLRDDSGQVSFQRLVEGNVALQVFALFDGAGRLEKILAQGERLLRELAEVPGWTLVTEGAELTQVMKQQTRGGLLALEGGDCLGDNPELLGIFYRMGVRSLMLTWNHRNRLADGAMETRAGGLSQLGLDVVRECERLGILLDISHLAPQGVEDLLAAAKGPVLASHSNCRDLWDHPRNLWDQQLQGVAASGGVVCINFYPPFLAGELGDWTPVFNHLDHALRVAGEDHVGIGSDFDGIDLLVPGLEGPHHMPALAQAMKVRGYGDSLIEKVMGGNLFRVYGQLLGL